MKNIYHLVRMGKKTSASWGMHILNQYALHQFNKQYCPSAEVLQLFFIHVETVIGMQEISPSGLVWYSDILLIAFISSSSWKRHLLAIKLHLLFQCHELRRNWRFSVNIGNQFVTWAWKQFSSTAVDWNLHGSTPCDTGTCRSRINSVTASYGCVRTSPFTSVYVFAILGLFLWPHEILAHSPMVRRREG